ncbi:hypothetical protein ACTXT7_017436 [Hymenolepis weldensis]
MTNFSRRFLPNSATVIFPLTELLKFKKIELTFLSISKEPKVTLMLSRDASHIAVVAILKQREGQAVQPLACFSAKVSPLKHRTQFETHPFSEFTNLLVTNQIRTTAYQSQATDSVERFHCLLKEALTAYYTPKRWVDALLLVIHDI